MRKQRSVAEARNRLPELLNEAEGGSVVEITRRGKPVAVLISVPEYERLTGGGGTFWEAVQEWRKTVNWDEVGDLSEVFKDIRDPAPGRDFRW